MIRLTKYSNLNILSDEILKAVALSYLNNSSIPYNLHKRNKVSLTSIEH